MKEIIINSKTHGNQIMLVDDDDFDFLSKRKWCLQKGRRTFYAQRVISGVKTYAHRIIMNNPALSIDHRDGNGLNNQKSNLRETTKSGNSRNCKTPITNKTGFKGVCFSRGKYTTGIYLNDKRIHLGTFTDPIKAAKAYNEAALKYHGEFARLNTIPCVASEV